MTGKQNYTVFYHKRPTYHASGKHGFPLLTISNLIETHVRLRQVEAGDLSQVWHFMQGENWSPNGEAVDQLKALGLNHTSMSVGDVMKIDRTGEYWETTEDGWRELT